MGLRPPARRSRSSTAVQARSASFIARRAAFFHCFLSVMMHSTPSHTDEQTPVRCRIGAQNGERWARPWRVELTRPRVPSNGWTNSVDEHPRARPDPRRVRRRTVAAASSGCSIVPTVPSVRASTRVAARCHRRVNDSSTEFSSVLVARADCQASVMRNYQTGARTRRPSAFPAATKRASAEESDKGEHERRRFGSRRVARVKGQKNRLVRLVMRRRRVR
jgi:hypothetical protein